MEGIGAFLIFVIIFTGCVLGCMYLDPPQDEKKKIEEEKWKSLSFSGRYYQKIVTIKDIQKYCEEKKIDKNIFFKLLLNQQIIYPLNSVTFFVGTYEQYERKCLKKAIEKQEKEEEMQRYILNNHLL